MLANITIKRLSERISLVAEESGMYYEDRKLASE